LLIFERLSKKESSYHAYMNIIILEKVLFNFNFKLICFFVTALQLCFI
jgi:hypothetical protein